MSSLSSTNAWMFLFFALQVQHVCKCRTAGVSMLKRFFDSSCFSSFFRPSDSECRHVKVCCSETLENLDAENSATNAEEWCWSLTSKLENIKCIRATHCITGVLNFTHKALLNAVAQLYIVNTYVFRHGNLFLQREPLHFTKCELWNGCFQCNLTVWTQSWESSQTSEQRRSMLQWRQTHVSCVCCCLAGSTLLKSQKAAKFWRDKIWSLF